MNLHTDTPYQLAGDEHIICTFNTSRTAYNREHLVLFFIGAVVMYGWLMFMGNPYPWTGIVGAAFAIFIRWIYVASEAMEAVWTLTNKRLLGPAQRDISLRKIKAVRTLFSAVQVVSDTGDKYMLKYLANPDAAVQDITAAKDNA